MPLRLTRSSRARLLAALLALAIPLVATAGDGERSDGAGLEPELDASVSSLTLRARLTPARPRAGGTFTVDVVARAGAAATSAAFHVVFDPTLVEPVPSGFREGGWLKRGGAPTSFLATTATAGDRVVVGVARLAPAGGAKRGGTVCRLVFRALAPGSTALAFDRAHVTSADGSEASLRFSSLPLTIRPPARRP